MLVIDNVTKKYGRFVAVNQVSFDVPPGKIFGFLGPNGAGKTTTMKMICGIVKPSSGRITVDGFDVGQEPLEVKARLGYVPDRPHLYERLTAEEYMYFIGGIYGMPPAPGRSRSKALLEKFGLGHVRSHLIESFSHGMKQRLVMASVFLHQPKLMIVDEPMVGLDPRGARLLKDVLRAEARENGLSVLLSTHTLEVADEVCDEVAVIHRGQLIARGSPSELRTQTGQEGKRLEEVFLQLTEEQDAQSDPSFTSGH
ncbi:MAG: ABC transporter ATP-binding protein [Myxococcota bacterium]|nr:ABC transporter ATP-binding protein [Myxococcota bacterium]